MGVGWPCDEIRARTFRYGAPGERNSQPTVSKFHAEIESPRTQSDARVRYHCFRLRARHAISMGIAVRGGI